jgi:hypothetical protein
MPARHFGHRLFASTIRLTCRITIVESRLAWVAFYLSVFYQTKRFRETIDAAGGAASFDKDRQASRTSVVRLMANWTEDVTRFPIGSSWAAL